MKTIVFAGDYKQAALFAKENSLRPQDFFYLSDPDQLRGLEGPLRNRDSRYRFQVYGSWWNRRDAEQIRQIAIAQGFSPGF